MTQRFGHLITEENAKWWALAAMCFALFMVMLDNTVVNVALPAMQHDLGASIAALEWVVNGYTLSFAVLLATGGRLGDIFGRRRVFLLGVVLFAVSSGTAGLAPSDGALVASRIAQGAGAALMMPATLSIITNAFPAHERGRAIGTWAGVSAMALAIGPLLGGFLTEHVSWRAIFYINIPVAAAAVVAALFAVRESRDESVGREVDWLGTAVFTAGMTAVVLALVEGNAWGWGSPAVVGLLAAAVVLLTAFGVIEGRVRAPIIQFEFLRSRNFVGANLVAFIVSFAMLAMFFFMALYIQNILEYSPLEAGIRFLPTTLMVIAIAPIAGRLTDRIGPRPLIVAGLSVVAVALYMQSRIDVATTYSDLLVPFVLMGIGIALTMSPMSTAAMNAVATAKAGLASGLLSMSRMVGGTFGIAVLGAVFQATSSSNLSSSLAGSGVSEATRELIGDELGSGALAGTLAQLPPQQARLAADAAREAFVGSMSTAIEISAFIALAGAVLALVLIVPKARAGAPEASPGAEDEELERPPGSAALASGRAD